jgi:hypothetical protein
MLRVFESNGAPCERDTLQISGCLHCILYLRWEHCTLLEVIPFWDLLQSNCHASVAACLALYPRFPAIDRQCCKKAFRGERGFLWESALNGISGQLKELQIDGSDKIFPLRTVVPSKPGLLLLDVGEGDVFTN